jgi:hypothetical protein
MISTSSQFVRPSKVNANFRSIAVYVRSLLFSHNMCVAAFDDLELLAKLY